MDIKGIFNEAINNFPRWMDIRKRHNKSNGGMYLHSIINELYDIEDQLYEFKKEFFAANYIDKEDTIIDHIYICNVGSLDIEDLKMIEPSVEVTTSFRDFYTKHYDAYYQDGTLHFLHDHKAIRYLHRGVEYKTSLDSFSVWNVFDEFALFLGLERFNGETNKELLARVFRVFNHPTNSTRKGIENSILNALSSLDKTIDKDSIKIETPSEDNLFKQYSEQELVIDYLINFNQDVYRSKVWDKSYWNHDFVELDYTAVKWDESISSRKDGVGYNSLQSELARGLAEDVDNVVTLDVYKESQQAIEEYIRKNKVEANIDLSLTKFNDVIKKQEVNYKIEASEALDITDERILVDCYNQSKRYEKYKIEDLVENIKDYKDYILRPAKLKKNNDYRIEFYPRDPYQEMDITHVTLADGRTSKDLLAEQIEAEDSSIKFPMESKDSSISNSRVKLYTTAIDQFQHSSNIVSVLKDNDSAYLSLEDASKPGEITINTEDMENCYCIMPVTAETVSILNVARKVTIFGDSKSSPEGVSIEGNKQGHLLIESTFKTMDIFIKSGDCLIQTYSGDGELISRDQHYGNKNNTIRINDSKVESIKIIKVGNSKLVIGDIRYSDYSLSFEADSVPLSASAYGVVIPKSRELKIKIESKTSYSPKIDFVFVGHTLRTNQCYHSLEFKNEVSSSAFLRVDATCVIKLIDSTNNKVLYDNLDSTAVIKNNENFPIELILDLTNMQNIEYSSLDMNAIPGKPGVYSATLAPQSEIKNIIIYGDKLIPLRQINLVETVKNHPEDKVYISNNVDGYIVKSKGGAESITELTRAIVGTDSNYLVINANNGLIEPVVINDENKTSRSFKSRHSKSYYSIQMNYKKGNKYVANNISNVYERKTTNIDMNQVFTPICDTSKLMSYTIISPSSKTQDADIYFESGFDWSLGQKQISITLPIDLNEHETYSHSVSSLTNSTTLRNRIPITDVSNLDLSEYLISCPDYMDVQYSLDNYEEVITVKDDGFNLLRFTNVTEIESVKIDGVKLDRAEFDLLKKGGYVVWNSDSYAGKTASVSYSYKVPQFLFFTDYNYLYNKVNYNVMAYEYIGQARKSTTESFSVKDLELTSSLDIDKTVKLIPYCSHPLFTAVADAGMVIVSKKATKDLELVTHSGYYYDNNRELFYLSDAMPKDKIVKNKHFEVEGADFMNNELIMYQESKNYLTYSSMRPSYKDSLCVYDFNDEHLIEELSELKELTACDNYTKWISFNNVIALNDESLEFSIKGNELPLSYSYLELPRVDSSKVLISLKASNPDNIGVGSKRKYGEHKLSNTNCISMLTSKPTVSSGTTSFILDNNQDRFYLINYGDNIISDIVVKPFISGEKIVDLHTKPIDKLGLRIDEHTVEDSIKRLYFDTNNSKMFQTDISSDNTILVDSSAHWGMTKLFSYKNDLNELIVKDLKVTEDYIASVSKPGVLKSKPIAIKNKESMKGIVVNINDIITASTKGFDINVYGSNSGEASELITQVTNTNTVIVPGNLLRDQITIEVIVGINKVINNIECHCEYFENPKHPLPITNYSYGFFDSKLYDLGDAASIIISSVDTARPINPDTEKLYVRTYKSDTNSSVYNRWIELKADNLGNIINEHILHGARYIQFRVELLSNKSNMKINTIDIEVK